MNSFFEVAKKLISDEHRVNNGCHSFTLAVIQYALSQKNNSHVFKEITINNAAFQLKNLICQHDCYTTDFQEAMGALAKNTVTFHVLINTNFDILLEHSGIISPVDFQPISPDPGSCMIIEREASSYYATNNEDFSNGVAIRTLANATKNYFDMWGEPAVQIAYYFWPLIK